MESATIAQLGAGTHGVSALWQNLDRSISRSPRGHAQRRPRAAPNGCHGRSHCCGEVHHARISGIRSFSGTDQRSRFPNGRFSNKIHHGMIESLAQDSSCFRIAVASNEDGPMAFGLGLENEGLHQFEGHLLSRVRRTHGNDLPRACRAVEAGRQHRGFKNSGPGIGCVRPKCSAK